MTDLEAPRGELILYQTEDGRTRIECRFEGDTLWLTQALMAELFETTPQNITQHLRDIYAEDELDEAATCKSFLQVRSEGNRSVSRQVLHYSLAAIIAVGFRVRSHRGSQFRRWANRLLEEHVVKGFTLDDERHKSPTKRGQPNYFEELLARIRDIRSSERVFWMKVLDIYATSADYDPRVEASRAFFKLVQNKMHWAAHGHTAAEVIAARADATKPNMGLTSWSSGVVRKGDIEVAKNYLTEDEIQALNRIVNTYIEFAELQATRGRVMYMRSWITKLDDFLRLSEREVLTHAGKVSHEDAVAAASAQYELFRKQQDLLSSPAVRDFEAAIAETKRIEGTTKAVVPRRNKERKKP
jgi:hypothetical protein